MPTIHLPNNYEPRDYQLPVWKYMMNGGKHAVLSWHRRAGKDLTSLQIAAVLSQKRVGLYWTVAPFYTMGERIIWRGTRGDGIPFLDAFPKELVASKHDTDKRITLKNGSMFQVVGADKPDRLVGTNPIGVIWSEWSLMSPHVRNLVRPILVENGGWEMFAYTPRGMNHGYEIYDYATKHEDWFASHLSITDTGVVTEKQVEEERAQGIPEELIAQEYYGSWNYGGVGAYYAVGMEQARKDDRICNCPWEPELEVHTAWDIGIGDPTAIWFYQMHRSEIRLIDYYEDTGSGLDHYIKMLREKPYAYGRHYAPHDIEVKEMSAGGKSRRHVASGLGINFIVTPNIQKDEGISAVRSILPRCWFDKEKCSTGIEALRQYHKKYNPTDDAYAAKPHHDWASHGADAFRYLALGVPKYDTKDSANYPRSADSEWKLFG